MAGPRGASGTGAEDPNRPQLDTAEKCDNLARLACAPGLKWEQVGAQLLEHLRRAAWQGAPGPYP